MSTYSDSKIRKARKAHQCNHCEAPIQVGQEYLSFALGQRWRVPTCLTCAKASPSYRCAAIDDLKVAA